MAVETITELLDLSQLARGVPLLAYFLPGSLSRKEHERLGSISDLVELVPVATPLPRFLDKEMFYSRTNSYAKRFSRARLGYLDMCFWRSNLFSEPRLENFDYVLTFDDDSQFLQSPDPYLLTAWDQPNWVIATADTFNHVTQRQIDTREELVSFTREFVRRHEVEVSDPVLASALAESNEQAFHAMDWSIGNFNVYRTSAFRSLEWFRWIYSVNIFGGAHRFRWTDIETLGVFGRLHFPDHLLNLKMISNCAYRSPREGTTVVKKRWRPNFRQVW